MREIFENRIRSQISKGYLGLKFAVRALLDRRPRMLLLEKLNQTTKATRFKKAQKFVELHYQKLTEQQSSEYSRALAVQCFKSRAGARTEEIKPRLPGSLRFFWVGASIQQDQSGFIQALSRLGNVVIFEDASTSEYSLTTEKMGASLDEVRRINDAALVKQVEKELQKNRIDLLLGQMWAQYYSEVALNHIQSLGVPIINIAMDDKLAAHWISEGKTPAGSVGLKTGVDLVLTTTNDALIRYAVEDMAAIFWPLASDPNLFAAPVNSARPIDVLFVGNRYGVRGEICAALQNKGIQIECYGSGWDNGYISAEENANLSKKAKIILGIGTVGHCSDVYTLKLRDFDSIMSGALYITHRNPDLLEIFEEGGHFECYENVEELYDKIVLYLKDDELRKRIATIGQRYAINEHSWDRRLFDTFNELGFLRN